MAFMMPFSYEKQWEILSMQDSPIRPAYRPNIGSICPLMEPAVLYLILIVKLVSSVFVFELYG